MIKVMIIAPSLARGGAERQLMILLERMDKTRFSPILVTYRGGGQWDDDLTQVNGLQYYCLKLSSNMDFGGMFCRLRKIVQEKEPDMIYGLLGDACTLAYIHAGFQKVPVVWGIRASDMNMRHYSVGARLANWLNARWSENVDAIIANSFAGRDYHVQHGYCGNKMSVIHNGIDTEYFRPDLEGAEEFRKEIDIPVNASLIGRAGRLDPKKGHELFIEAAALLASENDNVFFLVVGVQQGARLTELKEKTDRAGLAGRIRWVEPRDDMPAVYTSMTISTSTSLFGEGYPNVVAESLACATPCVVTDSGDSSVIVEQGGKVVVHLEAAEIASAWQEMLRMSDVQLSELGFAGRRHIVETAGVDSMVESTVKIFESLV